MKIEIFEKALCCETGVCGTDVDPELLRVTSVVAELKEKGINIERANLSTKPERFVINEAVIAQIKNHGVEILPLTLKDGSIVKEKIYPTNAELEAWTGVKLGKGGCNCGGGHSEKSSCGCGGHGEKESGHSEKEGCNCGGHGHDEKTSCCCGGKDNKKGCC